MDKILPSSIQLIESHASVSPGCQLLLREPGYIGQSHVDSHSRLLSPSTPINQRLL